MAASVLVFIVLGLFAVAYFSRRRFGILTLGLCAGALISQSFTGAVAQLIASQGVQIVAPPLATVVGIGLTLAPVLVLLTSGPAYSSKKARTFGSFLFAVLGILVLVPILKVTIKSDQSVEQFFMLAASYGGVTQAALIIWAVFDTMFATGKKGGKHGGHGGHGE